MPVPAYAKLYPPEDEQFQQFDRIKFRFVVGTFPGGIPDDVNLAQGTMRLTVVLDQSQPEPPIVDRMFTYGLQRTQLRRAADVSLALPDVDDGSRLDIRLGFSTDDPEQVANPADVPWWDVSELTVDAIRQTRTFADRIEVGQFRAPERVSPGTELSLDVPILNNSGAFAPLRPQLTVDGSVEATAERTLAPFEEGEYSLSTRLQALGARDVCVVPNPQFIAYPNVVYDMSGDDTDLVDFTDIREVTIPQSEWRGV